MAKEKEHKKTYLILCLIILSGLFLRVYNLGSQSFWIDEAYSVRETQFSLGRIIFGTDPNPPLYYSILYFWTKLLGISEFKVRLLSVTFSVISIWIFYLLGKLIFNKEVGIYSALFFAISPINILYSQEARNYSLLFLFSLLSMYFYLKLKKGFSKINAINYLISSILLVYSHFYGVLILLVQNLDIILSGINFSKIRISTRIKRWLTFQIIILISYLPFLIKIRTILFQGATSWIARPNFLDLILTFNAFIWGIGRSFFSEILWIIFFVIFFKFPFKESKKEFLFLFYWMIIPLILPFVFSLVIKPIFVIRYVLLSSFPLYIILSRAIENLSKYKKRIVISSILVLFLPVLLIQQNIDTKDDWNEISNFIKTNIQDDENIAMVVHYEIAPFSYYFSPECFKEIDITLCVNKEHIYPLKSITQLENTRKVNKTWLILSRTEFESESQEILKLIYSDFDIKTKKKFILNEDSRILDIFNTFLQKKDFRFFNEIEVQYLTRKEESHLR